MLITCKTATPIPESVQELERIHPNAISDEGQWQRVLKLQDGVILKYGGFDLAEEVLCMLFARELDLPVPRIIKYPGDPYHREPWSTPDPTWDGSDGVWYICMEEAKGVSLDTVVDTLPDTILESIGNNLKLLVDRISEPQSPTVASVTHEPLRSMLVPPQLQPTKVLSVGEFHQFLFSRCRCGTSAWAKVWRDPIPVDGLIRFTHGDLLPKNIMVDPDDGCRITAILDWEHAGYYPDYWEYCRMHDPDFKTEGWSKVLSVVFPGDGWPLLAVAAVHAVLHHIDYCA